MTRVDRAIVAALLAGLLVVGTLVVWPDLRGIVAPADLRAPASATPAPSAPAVPAGTLRLGIVGRPTSVSPFGARSQADRDLVALAFAGLVRVAPGGDVRPDLASDWTVDAAGRVYTFHLRPDATWQDGEPVTAGDVAFTIRALQDDAYDGLRATSWREVQVETPDERTVRFRLAHPLGGFLPAFAQPIAPAHLLGDVPVADLAADPFGRQPVGAGPFRLVSLDADQALLERVDAGGGSAGADAGGASGVAGSPAASSAGQAPAAGDPVDQLDVRFFDDATAAAAAFRGGGLDAVEGLPAADATGLAAQADVRVVPDQLLSVATVMLNLRPGETALRDSRVRRALYAAIDRDALVADVLDGFGSRADGLIPPGSPVFDPASNPRVAFSRAAAASLLRGAGWTQSGGAWRAPRQKSAFRLELISPDATTNPILAALADRIARDWRALGIGVTLVSLPAAVYAGDRLQAGAFDAAVVEIAIGHDPDLYPLLASSQVLGPRTNVAGVQDAKLDGLLTSARGQVDPAARQRAYAALQAYLSANRIVLPLVVRDTPLVLGPRVVGPSPRTIADGSERLGDVLTWRLANGR